MLMAVNQFVVSVAGAEPPVTSSGEEPPVVPVPPGRDEPASSNEPPCKSEEPDASAPVAGAGAGAGDTGIGGSVSRSFMRKSIERRLASAWFSPSYRAPCEMRTRSLFV